MSFPSKVKKFQLEWKEHKYSNEIDSKILNSIKTY